MDDGFQEIGGDDIPMVPLTTEEEKINKDLQSDNPTWEWLATSNPIAAEQLSKSETYMEEERTKSGKRKKEDEVEYKEVKKKPMTHQLMDIALKEQPVVETKEEKIGDTNKRVRPEWLQLRVNIREPDLKKAKTSEQESGFKLLTKEPEKAKKTQVNVGSELLLNTKFGSLWKDDRISRLKNKVSQISDALLSLRKISNGIINRYDDEELPHDVNEIERYKISNQTAEDFKLKFLEVKNLFSFISTYIQSLSENPDDRIFSAIKGTMKKIVDRDYSDYLPTAENIVNPELEMNMFTIIPLFEDLSSSINKVLLFFELLVDEGMTYKASVRDMKKFKNEIQKMKKLFKRTKQSSIPNLINKFSDFFERVVIPAYEKHNPFDNIIMSFDMLRIKKHIINNIEKVADSETQDVFAKKGMKSWFKSVMRHIYKIVFGSISKKRNVGELPNVPEGFLPKRKEEIVIESEPIVIEPHVHKASQIAKKIVSNLISVSTLSEEQEEFIYQFVEEIKKSKKDDIFCTVNNNPLSFENLILLNSHKKKLNDEIINFFIHWLNETQVQGHKLYVLNTFFYSKLVKQGPTSVHSWIAPPIGLRGLHSWRKKFGFPNGNMVIIPIHVNDNHWSLVSVDYNFFEIRYYDSIPSDIGHEICKNIKNTFISYAKSLGNKKHIDQVSSMNIIIMKTNPQKNDYDCGVFVLGYIISQFIDYLNVEWINQDVISNLRFSILSLIVYRMMSLKNKDIDYPQVFDQLAPLLPSKNIVFDYIGEKHAVVQSVVNEKNEDSIDLADLDSEEAEDSIDLANISSSISIEESPDLSLLNSQPIIPQPGETPFLYNLNYQSFQIDLIREHLYLPHSVKWDVDLVNHENLHLKMRKTINTNKNFDTFIVEFQ